MPQAGHIKNTVVLIFRHIQCLHLMNSEVAWVLVSSGNQVQPQIILDLDNLPHYLSVSYDYGYTQLHCGTHAENNPVKYLNIWHSLTY